MAALFKKIPLYFILFFFSGLSSPLNGSGPLTHIQEAKSFIARIQNNEYPLLSSLLPLISNEENLPVIFIAAVIPDLKAGVDLGFQSHAELFAQYLLEAVLENTALEDRTRAIAFGHIMHIATDIVMHQFVVPYLNPLSAVGAIDIFDPSQPRKVGNNENLIEGACDLYYGDPADLSALITYIRDDRNRFNSIVDIWLNLAEAYFISIGQTIGDKVAIKQALNSYIDQALEYYYFIAGDSVGALFEGLRAKSLGEILSQASDLLSLVNLADLVGYSLTIDPQEFARFNSTPFFSNIDFFQPYRDIFSPLSHQIFSDQMAGQQWFEKWFFWSTSAHILSILGSIGLGTDYFGNQSKMAVYSFNWETTSAGQVDPDTRTFDTQALPEKIKATAIVYPLTQEKGVAFLRIKRGLPGVSYFEAPVIAESQILLDVTAWENGASSKKELAVEFRPSQFKVFTQGFYAELAFQSDVDAEPRPLFTTDWGVYEALLGEARNQPVYTLFYGNDQFPASILIAPVISDTTPPGQPVITLYSNTFSSDQNYIEADFSSVDPDQLVSEYLYSVGHYPVYHDILNWQSTGPASHVRIGLPPDLWVGEEIYLQVRAKTFSNLDSDITISEKITKIPGTQESGETDAGASQAADTGENGSSEPAGDTLNPDVSGSCAAVSLSPSLLLLLSGLMYIPVLRLRRPKPEKTRYPII